MSVRVRVERLTSRVNRGRGCDGCGEWDDETCPPYGMCDTVQERICSVCGRSVKPLRMSLQDVFARVFELERQKREGGSVT